MDLRDGFVEGLVLFHSGFFREAVECFKRVLVDGFEDGEVWRCLVMGYYFLGEFEEALDWVYRWLDVDDKSAVALYCLGLILEKLGYFEEAILSYRQAIYFEPQGVEFYNCLATLLLGIGYFDEAWCVCQDAISILSNSTTNLILGNVFLAQQKLDEAISAYYSALEIQPRHPEILSSLGVAFEAKGDSVLGSFYLGYAAYRQQDYESAIVYFNSFKSYQQGNVEFYLALADCYQKLNSVESAILIYEEALKLFPSEVNIYLSFMLALQSFGRVDEAIKVANNGINLLPNNLAFQVESMRLLPVIYENTAEIEFYRNRFTAELNRLINETSLSLPETCKDALMALGYNTNFYLQYQGKNDLELQQKYGEFVCKVMALNYPEWVQPRFIFSPKNRKIRVGYVSACFQWHTVGIVFLGWLQNCNRNDFEFFGYSLDNVEDNLNQLYRLFCDSFHEIPHNLEALSQQILAAELDILVFLDVGMYAPMTQIAGLRLAPIQCAAWGHPVTTGLPTIDYFISAELMEPVDAEIHYSEKLIRLPNIGIFYKKPLIPQPNKNREYFGLEDEAVVYVSCQSLFKYLPQYDYVFAKIALQVSKAKFVFVSHESLEITAFFRRRLECVFAKIGLNFEDFCVILPRLSKLDYWNLFLVSDVFLDSFDFTGFLTSLEAISCDLPVVTRVGKFMRGCQSAGILQRISVTETLAQTEAEYINIAVNLGLDKGWREQLREKIRQQKFSLYEDNSCVEALEDFYRQLVTD